MNEFVEPPAPPPRRETPARSRPPWMGPPERTLPGVIALELVLAQTDRFAVCLSRLAAYATGFEFVVYAFAAPGQDQADLPDPTVFGRGIHRSRQGVTELPGELLRIGVQFSDGRKATNTGTPFYHSEVPPEEPHMQSAGGGGGGGNWHQSEWVWPLPPPGPIAFVCEWPAASIPLTRHELDAQVILDAAARAQVIFPDQRGER